MGRELFENFPVARQIFEEADDALGFSISRLCFEGPAEDLQLTENTQPAILTVSVAAFRAMMQTGISAPAFVAGHSLGEYSALVAAGALKFSDAVRTVRARGRYMQEAVPVGTGAMAAIIGGELSDVERVCEEARDGRVCSIANINSPNQLVIAGNTEAVDRAIELLKGVAKRVIKLNVSAPFHCALMKPAQDRLAPDLERRRPSPPPRRLPPQPHGVRKGGSAPRRVRRSRAPCCGCGCRSPRCWSPATGTWRPPARR